VIKNKAQRKKKKLRSDDLNVEVRKKEGKMLCSP
jgi:hypothetical protein